MRSIVSLHKKPPQQDPLPPDQKEQKEPPLFFPEPHTHILETGPSNPLSDETLELFRQPSAHNDLLEEAPSWRKRNITYIMGNVFALAGTISLISLSIIKDHGIGVNALLTTALGFLSFFPIVACLSKGAKDTIKDGLMDYGSPFFYFIATQTIVNIPPSTLATRLGYGIINCACGSQLAAQVHNTIEWKLSDDQVAKPDSELPLLNARSIEDLPQIQQESGDHRVSIFCGNRAISRLAGDGFKGAVAIGAIVAGSELTSLPSSIAFKVGQILLGHTLGGLTHEAVRALTKRYERRYEQEGSPTAALHLLRLIGKVEAILGILLPGVIGLDTPYSNIASGFFAGVLTRIYWIRFTRTPVSELDELLVNNDNNVRAKCKMITNIALGIICWTPFFTWQLIDSNAVQRAALITFTSTAILSFFSGRLLDRYDILNGTSRFKNTLFFNAHQLIDPPIAFIATTQVMKIGSEVLSQYPLSEAVLSCLAWADLGRVFGSHAAYIQTNRNRRYPAQLNTSVMLYTYFIAQQIEASARES